MTEYGVQIFGCGKEFRADPEAFFGKISRMGYSQVEPCLLLDEPGENPPPLIAALWRPEELPVFEEMMDRYGLTLSSCHVFAKSPLAVADRLLELAETTSVEAFVVNCRVEDVAQNYTVFAQECAALQQVLEEVGAELWIHNGGPEIRARVVRDGCEMTALEAVVQLCGGKVGVQVDTGWVLYGGVDPAQLLQRLGGALRSVHFKDMAQGFETLSGNDRFAVLGDGVTDCKAVFAAIPETGVSILIDQDASRGDFFADLERSVGILRACRP